MKVNCRYCGKEFPTFPSFIKDGGGKFCSGKCYSLSQRKNSVWRERKDGAVEILLTREQWAIIDVEDLERVQPYKWQASWRKTSKSFCATRTLRFGDVGHESLARYILQAPAHLQVDHVNHDTLDNRKANLRLCTKTENARNIRVGTYPKSSRYKGVNWSKIRSKWRARITVDGAQYELGFVENEMDAAMLYNTAAIQYFGEFALLNDLAGQ
jgi:hypothetical protein